MSSEWFKTLIFSGVILPILMVAAVSTYGFIVWILQMFVIGLPTA